ncbi:MAG: hypothetical protein ABIS06_19305 [Vicinamibacterales bacterium]
MAFGRAGTQRQPFGLHRTRVAKKIGETRHSHGWAELGLSPLAIPGDMRDWEAQ